MSTPITPVVPKTIARAKRIAKQFQEIYPHHPLSTCQATTAHLFGHKDWHALEQATKNQTPSAPFDDDLTDDELTVRRQAQMDIVCKELGGVDPKANHSRPAEPPSKSSMTEAEFGAYVLARESQKYFRLEMAANRWNVFLAAEAVLEVEPTAAKAPGMPKFSDGLSLYTADQLVAMPAALGRWWRHNIPHQPTVAEDLATFVVDPHRPVSLIKFGGYWGELCFHYAHTIDWTMAMGASFLVAERYSAICLQQTQLWEDAMLAFQEKAPETEKKKFQRALNDHFHESTHRYFENFPREDFAEVFSMQPSSFKANAEEVIEILATPSSNKGIWTHNQ